MPDLGVNIDHTASVRNARYRDDPAASEAEPDPVRIAHEAEMGGADGITVHLREDRRHIIDRDVERLRTMVAGRLNLEMAATDEMVAIALRLQPHTVMLVPEGRDEVTTEGGLDVAGDAKRFEAVVGRLRDAGLVVSAFIDADRAQVDACAGCGFSVCEVHTGPYAAAFFACGGDDSDDGLARELKLVRGAGERIMAKDMRFNAGHALNYRNVRPIAALPGVYELHIGHAIVSRAVFVGMREAVREMKRLMRTAGE